MAVSIALSCKQEQNGGKDVMEDDTNLPHGVMLKFSDGVSGYARGEINVPHKLSFHPDMRCFE